MMNNVKLAAEGTAQVCLKAAEWLNGQIQEVNYMGMTMSQKILAAHAGLGSVKAGQLIEARLDMVLGNDITSPVAINVFEEGGASSVFDNTKIRH